MPKGYKTQKTLDKEVARELVRRKITKRIDPLIDAQIANAIGIKYLVVRDKRTGKFVRVTEAMAARKLKETEEVIEVWEKDPCVQAFTDLMNRAIDKPKEQALDVNLAIGDWEEKAARLTSVCRARTRTVVS